MDEQQRPQLDFVTLRGILRLAGVTERELSGERMEQVVPRVLELIGEQRPVLGNPCERRGQ